MYQLPPKPHSVQETPPLVYQLPPKPHSVQETPLWCTNCHQSRTRYRRHPSGVPTATKATLGTGDTPPVYQTSTYATLGTGDTPLAYQTPPKPHSVQETPFRCTNCHQSHTRYRRHPSGVPNATSTFEKVLRETVSYYIFAK